MTLQEGIPCRLLLAVRGIWVAANCRCSPRQIPGSFWCVFSIRFFHTSFTNYLTLNNIKDNLRVDITTSWTSSNITCYVIYTFFEIRNKDLYIFDPEFGVRTQLFWIENNTFWIKELNREMKFTEDVNGKIINCTFSDGNQYITLNKVYNETK